MACAKLGRETKSVSVCPFRFESLELTIITLRRCRSPLPKIATGFSSTKPLCLEPCHGVECHLWIILGVIQKIQVAEILVVGSVSSISGGPKWSGSVCFRWDQNGYSAAGLDYAAFTDTNWAPTLEIILKCRSTDLIMAFLCSTGWFKKDQRKIFFLLEIRLKLLCAIYYLTSLIKSKSLS